MSEPSRVRQPQRSAWMRWTRFFTRALAGIVLDRPRGRLLVRLSFHSPTRANRPSAGHDFGRCSIPVHAPNTVGVLDLVHHRLLRKIPGGEDPDAILYDAKRRLIYVADHDGKTATLLDPASGVVATIALGGEPEYCQADPESGLVYQNLQDTSEVVVVDPEKRAVIRRYKLVPGQGPTGLAFDAPHHRLFSATANRKLVVLNSDTGEFLAALPIGWGVDGAAYDAELRRVYTANGLGSMTVIQQDSPDHYRVLEDVPTHFGGHSLVVDQITHRIYIAYFGSVAVYQPVRIE